MENNYSFFDGLLEQVELEHSLFESTLRSKFKSIREDGDISSQADSDDGEDVNSAPVQADQDTDNDDNGTKTKFIDKIKDIATKFIEWLKKIFTTIAEKIKNVIFNDNTIIKKYKEILTTKDNALDGFPGIDDFAAANLNWELPTTLVENVLNDIFGKFDNASSNILDGKTKESADKLKEACNSAFEKEVHKWYGYSKADWDKAFSKLVDNRMSDDALQLVKSVAAKEGSFKNKLNNLDYKYKLKGENRTKNLDDNIKNSDEFKESINKILETFNYIQPIMKTFVTTYIGYFKALRRACIVCGTHALKTLKNAKGEAGENTTSEQQAATESLVWLVDLQNNQYLDEVFSFI